MMEFSTFPINNTNYNSGLIIFSQQSIKFSWSQAILS